MHPDDTGEVSLVYLVGRVNQGIRREIRLRLGAWELSVAEFTALSILRRRPRLSNAQLARRSMVTPQTMIDIVSSLEKRELAHREVDPQHGRILRAELTDEGSRILDEAEPAIQRIQEEILDGVSDRDRDVTLRVMTKAMERLRFGLNGRAAV
jgi:DNA-binding MarR family transcriptional regulator